MRKQIVQSLGTFLAGASVVSAEAPSSALGGKNFFRAKCVACLDNFLRDPDKVVPGTLMSVIGRIDSAKDRKELIAYLRQEDRSFDLCR